MVTRSCAVYDVTQWAKSHPGGDIILLGALRELDGGADRDRGR